MTYGPFLAIAGEAGRVARIERKGSKMYIISQNRKFSLNESVISRFFLDEDRKLYAYCGESDEALLLGEYKTADSALDVMVAVIDAIEAGKNYQMPAAG